MNFAIFIIAEKPVLGALCLLAVWAATPAHADLPTAPFPIGAEDLSERRTKSELAKGLILHTIERSTPDNPSPWLISAGVARSHKEHTQAKRCLSELGLTAKAEPFQVPGLRAAPYFEITGGDFGTFGAAKAHIRPKAGCTYRVRARLASPNEKQASFRFFLLELNPLMFKGKLSTALSNDTVSGLETPSSMAQRHEALAVVNGGFFVMHATDGVEGDPTGLLVMDKSLVSEETHTHPYLAIHDTGKMRWDIRSKPLAKPKLVWRSGANMAVTGINRLPGQVRNCGHTASGQRPQHDVTCRVSDDLVVLTPKAGFMPDLRDRFAARLGTDGLLRAFDSPEMRGDRILIAQGQPAKTLKARMNQGPVDLDLSAQVTGDKTPLDYALGGAPLLVRNGHPIRKEAREGWAFQREPQDRAQFVHHWITLRNPRTAAGVSAEGTLWLLVAEGRGYERQAASPSLRSVGLSIEETRQLFLHLGVRDALNLDGGGSSALAINGQRLSMSSDASGERGVSDALILTKK